MPHVCWRISVGGRIRIIAASNRSISLPTRRSFPWITPVEPLSRWRCSFRHVGLVDEELSPRLRELATTRVLDRARVLGAALRVAYLVSASTTGALPNIPMLVEHGRLVLRFGPAVKALAGERVFARLRQLARLIGREPVMETR